MARPRARTLIQVYDTQHKRPTYDTAYQVRLTLGFLDTDTRTYVQILPGMILCLVSVQQVNTVPGVHVLILVSRMYVHRVRRAW